MTEQLSGRKLDAAVARAMGWTRVGDFWRKLIPGAPQSEWSGRQVQSFDDPHALPEMCAHLSATGDWEIECYAADKEIRAGWYSREKSPSGLSYRTKCSVGATLNEAVARLVVAVGGEVRGG